MKALDVYRNLLSSDTEQTPHRLEAFFDAIYAIVMTILVLGLDLPSDSGKLSSIQIIGAMFPQLYHFALTFFILAAFWGAHHRIFIMVKKVDPILIRITFLLLFITCLLPFTSSLSGDNHTDSSSVLLFDINLLLLGIIFTIQWIYIVKAGLTIHVPEEIYKYILLRFLVVPFVSLIACILVQLSSSWSSASFLLIFIFYALLLLYKPKSEKHIKDHTDEKLKISLSIPLSSSGKIYRSLTLVSNEMGTTREELVEKILARWEDENTVKIGNEAKLCNINSE